jgi:hypothetical protein
VKKETPTKKEGTVQIKHFNWTEIDTFVFTCYFHRNQKTFFQIETFKEIARREW